MATMMGKTVVYRNGKPLAPATAAAVDAFDRAFYRKFGLHLVVNSGLRTPEYQDSLHAAWVRYRNGGPWAAYALSSTAPQAFHVITNPKGGKSVDLGDTGADAGVATGYNSRANWARKNAHRFGLSPRGYTFGEPWHFELIGDPWTTTAGTIGKDDDMPSAEEVAKAVWNYAMSGGPEMSGGDKVPRETAGERLRNIRRSTDELRARTQRIAGDITDGGAFFKHGGDNITLWLYVLPNGDFVRIRDHDTAVLYKERAGASVTLSTEAIRALVADLEKAGGKDLSKTE